MVTIEPFRPEHLLSLRLQATQATAQALMTLDHGNQIAACAGIARTAVLDGEPIAAAGVIELWPGRAYAWAYIGEHAAGHWKAVHRAVVAALVKSKWRRIEMAVDVRDPGAKRWAAHLGFSFEGVARKWTTDGRDVEQWARVT